MSSKEIGVLEHAARHGFNVLLIGKHGVGKTAMVKEVFDKLDWTWKYFSASTIDPWVDLVGVPKEKNGVLELIRPANLDFDNLEAIFLDEYNRAPKKVRNAVMELIQFKSINGKKFPKLKVVWAAINPDDDEELSYDVEKLDPAQIDRFEQKLTVPNEPCPYYFKRAHGNIGTLAVKWWQEQTDVVKDLISPRRLEAGVKVFLSKGDPQYVFDPDKVNVGEFAEYLDKPDPIELLESHCGKPDKEKKAFLKDPNTFKHVRKDLLGKERYLDEYAHLIPEADLMTELRDSRGNRAITHVCAHPDRFEHLIPSVLKNARSYSQRVVDTFKKYRSKTSSMAIGSPKTVTINNKKHSTDALVLHITGTIAGYTRPELEDLMADFGIKLKKGQPTLDVTHIVVGSKTESNTKIDRAKRNGAEVISEGDFYQLIEELSSS